MRKDYKIIDVDFRKKEVKKVKSELPLQILAVTASAIMITIAGVKVAGLVKEKEENWDIYMDIYGYYAEHATNISQEGFARFMENNRLVIDSYSKSVKEDKAVGDFDEYIESYYEKEERKGRS